MNDAIGSTASSDTTQPADSHLAQVLRELADVSGDVRHDLTTALHYFNDERHRSGRPELTGREQAQVVYALRNCLPGTDLVGDVRAALRAVNEQLCAKRRNSTPTSPTPAVLPELFRKAANQIERQQSDSAPEGGIEHV